MPRQRDRVQQSIVQQRLRRTYRHGQGALKVAFLAVVNGQIKSARKQGHYWVSDTQGVDASGNVTYGAPREVPVRFGVVILERPGIKVRIGVYNGREEIIATDTWDAIRMGFDPHQANLLDPLRNFFDLEWAVNLRSDPRGNDTVQVAVGLYEKSDGTFGVFQGSSPSHIDILQHKPTTVDKSIVVCVWLNLSTNTTETTVSNEFDRSATLKHDPTESMTYVNQAAAKRSADTVGSRAYVVHEDTLRITPENMLMDLRPFFHSPLSTDTYNVIDGDRIIPASKDAFFTGTLNVISGTLSVAGELYVL